MFRSWWTRSALTALSLKHECTHCITQRRTFDLIARNKRYLEGELQCPPKVIARQRISGNQGFKALLLLTKSSELFFICTSRHVLYTWQWVKRVKTGNCNFLIVEATVTIYMGRKLQAFAVCVIYLRFRKVACKSERLPSSMKSLLLPDKQVHRSGAKGFVKAGGCTALSDEAEMSIFNHG